MWRFIARRVAMLIATLLVVSVLAFLIPYVGSEDPARTILRAQVADEALDPATVEALRTELGLDQPLVVQYLNWLRRAVTGDFGYSFTSRTSVAGLIANAFSVSVTLALTALVIALVLAVPLGIVAALRAGREVDNGVTVLTQVLVALPEYWIAPVSILVFALTLGWLPSAGWRGPAWVVLPACVLALRPLAYFTRVARASMAEVLNAPYMVAARARGLGTAGAIGRHGLRNGMAPVMTLFSLWLASLMGGSVVVEVIFAVPGMGRLVYEAVVNNDMPVIQAGIVFIVAIVVVINTLTDLAYAALNPAVAVSGGTA
jgi:peptide/nickel transport system permease protein